MSDSDRKIRPGEDQLVTALAAGKSIAEAAKAAGVSERTARRWLDEETIRQRVEAARAEFVRQALAQLSSAASDAVKALRALLKSENDNAKLGAARAILTTLIPLKEHFELEARISQLEAQLPQKGIA